MFGKYAIAVTVAFVVSIASSLVLISLGIRCDSLGAFVSFCISSIIMLIVGFAGVFLGTLCLPEAERRTGSKRLLIIGLIFSILPSLFMFLWPLIPLAIGGSIPMVLLKKLDQENSMAAKERRLAIILSVSICLIITFMALLAAGGRPTTMTKEKALTLFAKVGGVNKANQEANTFFKKVGTNEPSFFLEVNRTNYPALCGLGWLTDYDPGSLDSAPVFEIQIGNHFHHHILYVFPPGFDTNKAPILTYCADPLKCIQITSNIFATKNSF